MAAAKVVAGMVVAKEGVAMVGMVGMGDTVEMEALGVVQAAAAGAEKAVATVVEREAMAVGEVVVMAAAVMAAVVMAAAAKVGAAKAEEVKGRA